MADRIRLSETPGPNIQMSGNIFKSTPQPKSFIDRLLALSDKYETDGSHGPASQLRRELVVELKGQLEKIDEARASLSAEMLSAEMRDRLDIGKTE